MSCQVKELQISLKPLSLYSSIKSLIAVYVGFIFENPDFISRTVFQIKNVEKESI